MTQRQTDLTSLGDSLDPCSSRVSSLTKSSSVRFFLLRNPSNSLLTLSNRAQQGTWHAAGLHPGQALQAPQAQSSGVSGARERNLCKLQGRGGFMNWQPMKARSCLCMCRSPRLSPERGIPATGCALAVPAWVPSPRLQLQHPAAAPHEAVHNVALPVVEEGQEPGSGLVSVHDQEEGATAVAHGHDGSTHHAAHSAMLHDVGHPPGTPCSKPNAKEPSSPDTMRGSISFGPVDRGHLGSQQRTGEDSPGAASAASTAHVEASSASGSVSLAASPPSPRRAGRAAQACATSPHGSSAYSTSLHRDTAPSHCRMPQPHDTPTNSRARPASTSSPAASFDFNPGGRLGARHSVASTPAIGCAAAAVSASTVAAGRGSRSPSPPLSRPGPDLAHSAEGLHGALRELGSAAGEQPAWALPGQHQQPPGSWLPSAAYDRPQAAGIAQGGGQDAEGACSGDMGKAGRRLPGVGIPEYAEVSSGWGGAAVCASAGSGASSGWAWQTPAGHQGHGSGVQLAPPQGSEGQPALLHSTGPSLVRGACGTVPAALHQPPHAVAGRSAESRSPASCSHLPAQPQTTPGSQHPPLYSTHSPASTTSPVPPLVPVTSSPSACEHMHRQQPPLWLPQPPPQSHTAAPSAAHLPAPLSQPPTTAAQSAAHTAALLGQPPTTVGIPTGLPGPPAASSLFPSNSSPSCPPPEPEASASGGPLSELSHISAARQSSVASLLAASEAASGKLAAAAVQGQVVGEAVASLPLTAPDEVKSAFTTLRLQVGCIVCGNGKL